MNKHKHKEENTNFKNSYIKELRMSHKR